MLILTTLPSLDWMVTNDDVYDGGNIKEVIELSFTLGLQNSGGDIFNV